MFTVFNFRYLVYVLEFFELNSSLKATKFPLKFLTLLAMQKFAKMGIVGPIYT